HLDRDSGQLGRFCERVDWALSGAPGEVVEPIEGVGVHRLDNGIKIDAAAQEELDEPDALDVVEGQIIACVFADDPARPPFAKALLALAAVARELLDRQSVTHVRHPRSSGGEETNLRRHSSEQNARSAPSISSRAATSAAASSVPQTGS